MTQQLYNAFPLNILKTRRMLSRPILKKHKKNAFPPNIKKNKENAFPTNIKKTMRMLSRPIFKKQ